MNIQLLQVINQIRVYKGLPRLDVIQSTDRLRDELQLESLDLAELTVCLEEVTGIDIFADGLVHTVGDVEAKLEKG